MLPDLAAEIRQVLRESPPRDVPAWRVLRRGWSRALASASPAEVIALGLAVTDVAPWGRLTAYELVASHPGALAALTPKTLGLLGRGLADWASVDTFARGGPVARWRHDECMRTFTAVIERCPDTGLLVGYVPGFPGAHSQGESLDELNENLREAIAMLLEDGEPRPEGEFVGTSLLKVG